MIIPNGCISILTEQEGGGIDPETGFPTEPSASWSEGIPCQYISNDCDRFGTAGGGQFTIAQYTIYVDGPMEEAERLKLTNALGKELGEYAIKNAEYLEAVDQTRILTD